MRVLSIDWDYFMNCSDEFRTIHFPDGGNENIGIALSTHIWMSRYATDPELEKVKVRTAELDAVKRIIDKNKEQYYYAVVESHKHLGEFLLDPGLESKIAESGLTIVNIDHHHDAYNVGESINCGNWANKVLDKYPDAEITWIADVPELSCEDYRIKCSTALSDADRDDYDVIFLCHSDVWTPPHLDKHFGALNRYISKRSLASVLRQEIMNRWSDEAKRYIRQHHDVMTKFRATYENGGNKS